MSFSDWLHKPAIRRSMGVGLALAAAFVIGWLLWPAAPAIGERQHLEAFESFFASIDPECSAILARRDELPVVPKEVEDCADKQAAQKKGYRDLAQAIRAANAAEDSAWLSYLQTRASIVGAALVLLTLGATAWAAWAAADAAQTARMSAVASAKAADAAEAAVAVASKTAERQLRAYILHHHCRIISFVPPEKARANVTIRNSGHTPARDVEMRMGITIGEKEGVLPKFILPDTVPQSRGSLAANAMLETEPESSRPFTPEEYAAFSAGRIAIYVFGEVRYRDDFGNGHTTKVRLFYDKSSVDRGTDIFSTDVAGNEAT
jgi:guanyl-specific ribonuclease Sa